MLVFLQVDWNRLISLQIPSCNFKLLDQCKIPDYLSLSDFARLRCVSMDASKMTRLSSCYNCKIGPRTWDNLSAFIPLRRHVLPRINIACGNETCNKNVDLFLKSGVSVLSLYVALDYKKICPPTFVQLPPLVKDLSTWDVPEHILAQWSSTSQVTDLQSDYVDA